MVSVVVIDHAVGGADNAIAPPDAAEKVACWRVVTADTEVVPADPGSATCNSIHVAAMANDVLRKPFSMALAVFTVCNPTVIGFHPFLL
jgi:hypothetical protein